MSFFFKHALLSICIVSTAFAQLDRVVSSADYLLKKEKDVVQTVPEVGREVDRSKALKFHTLRFDLKAPEGGFFEISAADSDGGIKFVSWELPTDGDQLIDAMKKYQELLAGFKKQGFDEAGTTVSIADVKIVGNSTTYPGNGVLVSTLLFHDVKKIRVDASLIIPYLRKAPEPSERKVATINIDIELRPSPKH